MLMHGVVGRCCGLDASCEAFEHTVLSQFLLLICAVVLRESSESWLSDTLHGVGQFASLIFLTQACAVYIMLFLMEIPRGSQLLTVVCFVIQHIGFPAVVTCRDVILQSSTRKFCTSYTSIFFVCSCDV